MAPWTVTIYAGYDDRITDFNNFVERSLANLREIDNLILRNEWGGGGRQGQQQSPQSDELIHCDPKVKKQINSLLGRIPSTNQNFPKRELGFEIERINEQIKVNPIRMSTEDNEFRPNITENTIAVVHHHSNGNATLSPADKSYATGSNNSLGKKLVVYAFAVDRLLTTSKLINGNNPKDEKGKDRVINPADCPKKKKK